MTNSKSITRVGFLPAKNPLPHMQFKPVYTGKSHNNDKACILHSAVFGVLQ